MGHHKKFSTLELADTACYTSDYDRLASNVCVLMCSKIYIRWHDGVFVSFLANIGDLGASIAL